MPTVIAQLVNYLSLLLFAAVMIYLLYRGRRACALAWIELPLLERVLLVVAMLSVIAMVPALNFRTSVVGPVLFAIAAAATIARLGLRRRRSRRSRD